MPRKSYKLSEVVSYLINKAGFKYTGTYVFNEQLPVIEGPNQLSLKTAGMYDFLRKAKYPVFLKK